MPNASVVRDGENEDDLADQVDELRVVEMCGCGDDFCQSFSTGPPPEGAYPYENGRAGACGSPILGGMDT